MQTTSLSTIVKEILSASTTITVKEVVDLILAKTLVHNLTFKVNYRSVYQQLKKHGEVVEKGVFKTKDAIVKLEAVAA